MLAERDHDGLPVLRRGFEIEAGAPVLIAEDVITTAGTVRELIELVRIEGARPVAVACIVNRSDQTEVEGAPIVALARMRLPVYSPNDLPAELAAIEPTKPGSRQSRQAT